MQQGSAGLLCSSSCSSARGQRGGLASPWLYKGPQRAHLKRQSLIQQIQNSSKHQQGGSIHKTCHPLLSPGHIGRAAAPYNNTSAPQSSKQLLCHRVQNSGTPVAVQLGVPIVAWYQQPDEPPSCLWRQPPCSSSRSLLACNDFCAPQVLVFTLLQGMSFSHHHWWSHKAPFAL